VWIIPRIERKCPEIAWADDFAGTCGLGAEDLREQQNHCGKPGKDDHKGTPRIKIA
jgi:hypothetical protein